MIKWLRDLVNGVRNMPEWLSDMLKAVWRYIWEWMWSVLEDLFDLLGIPDLAQYQEGAQEKWDVIGPYIDYVDSWVPLTFGITLFGLYWVFWLAWIPVKIIARHLPGVGG